MAPKRKPNKADLDTDESIEAGKKRQKKERDELSFKFIPGVHSDFEFTSVDNKHIMEVGYLMTSKDESYHNMHSRTKVFVERSTRYLLFRVQQDDPKTGESRYETPRAGHVGFWLLRIQQYTDEKGPIPIRTMKEYKQALHWILECRVDGKLPNELPHMKYTSSKEFKKKLKDWQPKRTAATATENGASGVSQLQQCNTLAGAPVLRSTSGPLSRRNHNLSTEEIIHNYIWRSEDEQDWDKVMHAVEKKFGVRVPVDRLTWARKKCDFDLRRPPRMRTNPFQGLEIQTWLLGQPDDKWNVFDVTHYQASEEEKSAKRALAINDCFKPYMRLTSDPVLRAKTPDFLIGLECVLKAAKYPFIAETIRIKAMKDKSVHVWLLNERVPDFFNGKDAVATNYTRKVRKVIR